MPNSTERRFKFSIRTLTGILIVALLIGYAIYARLSGNASNHFRINIIVPSGLMAVFITFYLFSEFNRVRRAKRDERRENMNERRQQILDNVIKGKDKNSDNKND